MKINRVAGAKTNVLSAVILFSVISGIACFSSLRLSDGTLLAGDEDRAIVGRIVSIPAKVYKDAFKVPGLRLGQCPLVMLEGSIKTCKDEFEGEEVHIAKGSTTVDVSRVQTSEDILLHVMGGIGASIGVLGLVSITPKVKVAVTTETNRKTLNLMSSYVMSRGLVSLHRPRPKRLEGDDGALFLSEVELGGNEMLLVTLEFESEKQKVEVEVSVTFKILFISITAKLNYVNEKFNSKASCRVQFKSSWREDEDVFYSRLSDCIPKVRQLEDMYTGGPKALKALEPDDEKLHYFYYFSSWKASPYGKRFNLALINHDLEFLTEQNTEINAVIQEISKLNKQVWPGDVRSRMLRLNESLTDMTKRLSAGLEDYHTLQPEGRQQLRDIYGESKAPLYFKRHLEKITTRDACSTATTL